jgi:hypothetical protein
LACVLVLRIASANAMAPRKPEKMSINWNLGVIFCVGLRNYHSPHA